jgi:dienelactone hydrolase
MNRREWFSLTGACLAGARFAAADRTVSYYRDYAKCWPEYLSGLAQRAYEKRNRALSLLTTAHAIQQRQTWVREAFWRLSGGEPERTPLNPKTSGTFERAGYRVEKLVYESRPSVFVSANLYIPTAGQPPYPGILFQMGHTADGKGAASYQKCCQGLARLGYVVLGFDPLGQGERINYPDASGIKSALRVVTDEHSLPGKQLLLLGDSASRFLVWDAVRSLDYLASHPLVDPKRLASTGQSGGGTLTMLLACVDSRLSAAAVCSGNTENEACANFDPPGSPADAEQDLIGAGAVGFDRWDLLYPLAPKPLLILVSQHDFFGTYAPRYLSSGREEYAKLAGVYSALGFKDRLAWRDTPVPHSLSYALRLEIYNWFERWVKGSQQRIESEPPVNPEPHNLLWAGPTGNVHADFGSLRPIDLIRQEAQKEQLKVAGTWQHMFQLQLPPTTVRFRHVAATQSESGSIAAKEVAADAGMWIPVWLLTPPSSAESRFVVLFLDPAGRNAHIGEGDLYQRLARSGTVVCAADVRGIGDSRPEVGQGDPAYTIGNNKDEEYAWASLMLGRSVLAQRTADILNLMQAIRNESGGNKQRLIVAARGELTVPALFAFAASPLADSLYLAGGLVSYRNVLDTALYQVSLSSFAWNLFQVVDLPLLAAQAAPRRIHLAGTVDAAGNPLDDNVTRTAYPGANVTVSTEPNWDERILKAF